ncbi:phosphoadenylyl-sulfate reductase [Sulfurospirillum arcachonense]|uniref:phosphoadenylyl-sulfate reductase n=1 Tax=Sulfurospirillum arcachonense TaxID=57666 RepID=UPI00046AB69C|nr:phosphoadenylyl-sulfate reductase [Sulfurospirillum arcachonense]
MKNNIDTLKQAIKGKNTQEVLAYFLNELDVNIAFASSLGAEDQVLTDILHSISDDAKIFTLDTGRLPKETYDLIEKTNVKYKKNIKIYFPQADKVEALVNEKGMFSFYNSIDERKECCYIRKIEPLKRALKGLDIWITGLRREQSITRDSMEILERDEGNGLLKLNPLIDWSEEEVWEHIKKNNVPYNKLHDQGYPSIGCQPCSRAVQEGADIRSGRWWWENPEHKECGLHVKENK